MADPGPVRFVAPFTVDEPERYRIYEKGFFPILTSHGGRFLNFDDAPTVLEGEHEAGRTVLLEFGSQGDLMGELVGPPEDRELAEHRHASTATHEVYFVHHPPRR